MADASERGVLKRVILNQPPRHSKSKFTSIHFPAWALGKHPDWQILEASHTASPAQEFGRELRNLVARDEYRSIFPDFHLARESQAAGRWNTAEGGGYFAAGTSGALAGRGANLAIDGAVHAKSHRRRGRSDQARMVAGLAAR